MAEYEYNIESYEDLKFAREQIRKDNKKIKQSFKENPIIKISSSLLGGESVNNTFVNNLAVGNRSSAAKMIKALLLASKVTRKYFIAYTIAKEMVPFTLNKVSELFKKQ